VILKNEIAYLEKLIGGFVRDFKEQMSTLMKLHEQESKDLQRSFAYQKRGEGPNTSTHQIMQLRNFHKIEVEELKIRHFNIIDYFNSSLTGIKQCLNDLIDGSLPTLCLEKCSLCQRIIRI
jgi:hypothetical protein